jgi:hypothetical protein
MSGPYTGYQLGIAALVSCYDCGNLFAWLAKYDFLYTKSWQNLGDSESGHPTFVSALVQCQFAKYTENIHFSAILQYSGLKMDSRGYTHYLWTYGKGVD